jgi:hypothetical protein
VTVTNETAREFQCGAVAVKGEIAARILEGVAANLGLVRQLASAADVLRFLQEPIARRTEAVCASRHGRPSDLLTT